MVCLFGHKWNGCKCEKCGKIRNEQHDWDLCKGVCKRCGAKQAVQHDWHGCKCSRCDRIRDEQHNWKQSNSCVATCLICGAKHGHHTWGTPIANAKGCQYTCEVCGEVEIREHEFQARIANMGNSGDFVQLCSCAHCGTRNDNCNPSKARHAECLPIPGTGKDMCGACGYEREHKCYEFSSYLEPIDGCRKRCNGCGTLYYDHNYKLTDTKKIDVVNYDTGEPCVDKYETYVCQKCGHTYTVHVNYGYGEKQFGKVE